MKAACNSVCHQSKGMENNRSCVCQALKRRTCVLWLLLAALLVFVFQQLFLWDVWSCAECNTAAGCTEVVYDFCRPSWFVSIYHDDDLHYDCGLYSQNSSQWRAIYNSFNNSTKSPDIHTKCGTVKPVLLNPDTRRNISHHNHQLTFSPQGSSSSAFSDVVPNIVHYISIGSREFTFLNYISFLSVHRFQHPNFIYIHGDALPYGYWWNQTLQQVPSVHFVPREIPVRVQGLKVPWIEHSSDIMRLQTIYDNGGIYIDTDIILLKSFTPLLSHNTVLGRETSYGLGSGIILARPRAPFVCIWRQIFRTYIPWPWHWAKYAVWTPNHLAKVIPDEIHIEKDTFHRPNFEETEILYKGHYNWSESYAMHIWKRYGHVPIDPQEIDSLNSTLGEIMRHVYYGNSRLRPT